MMKNFKILFSALLFIVFFIQCTENHNQDLSQLGKNKEIRRIPSPIDNSCLKDNLPPFVFACEFGTLPMTVELPQYDGCQFHIAVEFYRCGDEILYVGDFWFTQAINCTQYNIDYNNAVNNNTLPSFELNFDISIWFEINEKLIATSASPSSNFLTINYVVGSCSYTCYEVGEPNPNGFSTILPVTYSCGSNCCKVIREYKKVNGIYVPLSGPSIDVPDEECEDRDVRCLTGSAPKCTGGCDELIGF